MRNLAQVGNGGGDRGDNSNRTRTSQGKLGVTLCGKKAETIS